mgnify:CR=1 FL=1|tara:strand:+ start:6810 stop:7328 length:519 start_codon:yes stop_codon:yes gene_type:complete
MVAISLIAAMAKNRVIGNNNNLPWQLPNEMAYFRQMTLGKPVILGRKTFQSFGERPLPKRPHIVITRDRNYAPEGVEIAHTMSEAIELAHKYVSDEIMVIGGGEIYKAALEESINKYTTRIYLTEINLDVAGEIKFPEFEKSKFKEISRQPQSENGINYDFVLYESTLTNAK